MSAQERHEQTPEHGGLCVRLSDEGSDSNAKRMSRAALRHAAPSYGSIFGQKSELAHVKTLEKTKLEWVARSVSSTGVTHGSTVTPSQRTKPSAEDRRTHKPIITNQPNLRAARQA